MKKKTKSQKSIKFSPSPLFLFTLIILLVLSLGGITWAQNKKISDLQKKVKVSKSAQRGYEDNPQKNKPVCERDTEGMSSRGSLGSKVLTRENNKLTIENQTGLVFTICPNAKVYDVESGKMINQEEIQPGVSIYFKTTDANFINEIELVSKN